MHDHNNDHHSPRIVVGVDGSQCSKAALRWAISQARLTGATVDAVGAWLAPAMSGYSYGWAPTQFDGDNIQAITEKALAETVAEVVGSEGEQLHIGHRAVQGHPAQVLVDAAAGAQMLVVGSRGHGTFTGILLGSVSQHCVQHAPCPVTVIRL